jgi:hypothetical protein|tara:strand:- start:28 stop:264 length:237 start_codon:yes stop_codon:yes gene_type:complete
MVRAGPRFPHRPSRRRPHLLAHEEKACTAKWFRKVIEQDTGARPDFLGLIREDDPMAIFDFMPERAGVAYRAYRKHFE